MSDPTGDFGVLLMAYGGPESLDDVEPFLRELMGRVPSPEVLERVKLRYLTIGGKSPLPEIAAQLADEVGGALSSRGRQMQVDVGFRYTDPRIAQTLARMYEAGIRRVATVSLSPFESPTTTEAYRNAIAEAAKNLPGLETIEVPLLSKMSVFRDLLAGGLAIALENLTDESLVRTLIVMTAHSLPCGEGDVVEPYVEGVRSVADKVASMLALGPGEEFSDDERLPGIHAFGNLQGGRPWLVSYQSQGVRACEWLQPDIDAVIDAAIAAGHTAIAVAPIGFATDHMETLYDLDVCAAEKALNAGLDFSRGDVPNADPRLAAAIADSVIESLDLTLA